jgi:short-subunit dehydrogenase
MAVYTGKVVVITGASSGIGKALCLALAEQRPRLVLAARDQAALEAVAESCAAKGADTLVVPTDVSSPEACRALIEKTVERFKALDVLVNNAGIGMIARFDETKDLSVYEHLMRVNYLGCVYPTYHALPHLKKSRGQIVAMASLAGLAPYFVRSEIHRRAAGPDGRPLGTSAMQESKIMTAEECAALTVRAMERRQRQLVMTLKGKVGRFVRLLAPGVVDAIARRAVAVGK